MTSIKKKIISSIVSIVAIVSLFGFGAGSYAWFHNNRTVSSQGITISAVADSQFSFSYELFYRNNTNNTVVHKNGGGNDFDLSLQDYDTGVSESIAPFNNILKVTVNFFNKKIDNIKSFKTEINCLQTTNGGNYTGGEGSATRKYLDNTGYQYSYKNGTTTGQFICDSMSNLIQFKSFIYSYNIGSTTYLPDSSRPCLVNTTKRIDNSSYTSIYNSASSIFSDVSEKDTFVTGSSKNTKITKNIQNIPGEATSMILFIEYNYCQDLFDNYLRNNEYLKNREFGDTFDITSLNLDVTFKKDINLIRFSSESRAA